MNLAKIQALVKAPKGQFNNFGKYKYRSCEDIVEAIKPVINPLGFAITLSDEVILIGQRFYIKATATLTDGKETYTATAFAREEEVKKGMDGSQITGASSSYARKYALNGLFAIDDTKDADSTNTGKDDLKTASPAISEDSDDPAPETTLYNHKKIGDSKLPLISNKQFKQLCERVEKGDKEAGEKAKTVFSFEQNQLNLLNLKLQE